MSPKATNVISNIPVPGCALKVNSSSASSGNLAQYAFDNSTSTKWESNGPTYRVDGMLDTSYNSAHKNMLKTTFVSYPKFDLPANMNGEWIEIDFKVPVDVIGYSITASSSGSDSPATWRLLAHQPTWMHEWYEIHSMNGENRWGSNSINKLSYPLFQGMEKQFVKFRLVIAKTNGARSASIRELSFLVKQVPAQLKCNQPVTP